MKSINKASLLVDKNSLTMLKRELQILKTLDHPNLVKFYEVYQDRMKVRIIMECLKGGSFNSYLSCTGDLIDE